MDIAYVYDVDGDESKTTGYSRHHVPRPHHRSDRRIRAAPRRRQPPTPTSPGSASFEDGGDPTNDFERYELLSSETIERDAADPRDYRMLMAAGPFTELLPEQHADVPDGLRRSA